MIHVSHDPKYAVQNNAAFLTNDLKVHKSSINIYAGRSVVNTIGISGGGGGFSDPFRVSNPRKVVVTGTAPVPYGAAVEGVQTFGTCNCSRTNGVCGPACGCRSASSRRCSCRAPRPAQVVEVVPLKPSEAVAATTEALMSDRLVSESPSATERLHEESPSTDVGSRDLSSDDRTPEEDDALTIETVSSSDDLNHDIEVDMTKLSEAVGSPGRFTKGNRACSPRFST